jgi:hypothetical protein
MNFRKSHPPHFFFTKARRSSEFSTRINLTSDELKLSSQNIITINNKKKYGIDFLIIGIFDKVEKFRKTGLRKSVYDLDVYELPEITSATLFFYKGKVN